MSEPDPLIGVIFENLREQFLDVRSPITSFDKHIHFDPLRFSFEVDGPVDLDSLAYAIRQHLKTEEPTVTIRTLTPEDLDQARANHRAARNHREAAEPIILKPGEVIPMYDAGGYARFVRAEAAPEPEPSSGLLDLRDLPVGELWQAFRPDEQRVHLAATPVANETWEVPVREPRK